MDKCKDCYNMDCIFVSETNGCDAVEDCDDFQPMRNADRIRAMTNEELAEWIAYEIWKAFAQGAGNSFFNQEEAVKLENQEWLDWLRKEVE